MSFFFFKPQHKVSDSELPRLPTASANFLMHNLDPVLPLATGVSPATGAAPCCPSSRAVPSCGEWDRGTARCMKRHLVTARNLTRWLKKCSAVTIQTLHTRDVTQTCHSCHFVRVRDFSLHCATAKMRPHEILTGTFTKNMGRFWSQSSTLPNETHRYLRTKLQISLGFNISADLWENICIQMKKYIT